MGRTDLPWLMAGRLVRPCALAVSLACASLGYLIVSGQSLYGAGYWSHALAAVAFTAALMLWVGWWNNRTMCDRLMRHGLLLSAGVFAARASYMVLTGQPAAGVFVACWTVASAGAYLLEALPDVDDDERRAWSTRHGAGVVERE